MGAVIDGHLPPYETAEIVSGSEPLDDAHHVPFFCGKLSLQKRRAGR